MTPPLNIAFDVDDTLIIPSVATGFDRDAPNYETIAIFNYFAALGCHMVIWSGGGVHYAQAWAHKLGLEAEIRVKQKDPDIDIAFDDCEVNLGKVNVRVKRINNSISRKEWNKHEPEA